MEELTEYFTEMIECVRRGKQEVPFDPAPTLTIPAFFFEDDVAPIACVGKNNIGEYTKLSGDVFFLPFEQMWLVGRHNDFMVAVYCREWGGSSFLDAIWLGEPPFGRDGDSYSLCVAYGMIDIMQMGCERVEFDCEHRDRINRGRAKAKNNPIAELPRFIRVGRSAGSGSHRGTGTGSQRQPHNRRGHWRHYRSGKQTWINDCKIHGGSTVPRDYIV